jgi:hypothetical protein
MTFYIETLFFFLPKISRKNLKHLAKTIYNSKKLHKNSKLTQNKKIKLSKFRSGFLENVKVKKYPN